MAQLTAGPVWSALEISYIEMELHGVIKIRITAGFQCMADTLVFFNGKFHVAVGSLYYRSQAQKNSIMDFSSRLSTSWNRILWKAASVSANFTPYTEEWERLI